VHACVGAGGDFNAGAIESGDGLVVIDAQQNRELGEKFRDAFRAATGASRSVRSWLEAASISRNDAASAAALTGYQSFAEHALVSGHGQALLNHSKCWTGAGLRGR
jgi:hypothetical protein